MSDQSPIPMHTDVKTDTSYNQQERESLLVHTPRSLLPFLKYLLAALPLMTATIYLCGMSYHVGYLEEYGLTNSQFPLASDETIFVGFVSIVTMVEDKIIFVGAAIITMLLLLVIAASTAKKREALWQKTFIPKIYDSVFLWIDSKRPTKKDTAPYITLVEWLGVAYGLFAVLTVPTALVCMAGLLSFLQGSSTAKIEQEKMQKGFFTKHTAQVTLENNEDEPMLIVACNSNHCAYWNKDKTILIRHEQIKEIRTYEALAK
ncbi:hypothetical protein [Aeromonas veronii]|uniref:hypothetical protein n=1 Tax=Aeromonas veronii TaxID=654 RepID=UPI001118F982|nr:hypothetical protein [Aeromonas veronii]